MSKTARKPPATPEPPPARVGANWQQTNPDYQYSPPQEVIFNGMRCVEIDGGKWSDMIYDFTTRGN